MCLKRIYLFFLLIMLTAFSAFSSHIFNYSDINAIIKLDNGVQVYLDATHKFVVKDFISGKASMKINTDGVLNFENTSDNIWLKFTVDNKTSAPLFLQFGNPELEYIACYGVKNDKIIWIEKSGNKYPFYTRYLKSNRVCLPIGNQNLTVYVKINSGSGLYMPLIIGSLKSLSDSNHFDDLFNGALFGIMLVLIFYNFFLFLSIRDRLYIQYCIYLLCSTSMMLYLEGLQFDLLWRNEYTLNNSHLANIIVATTTAAAIWFSSSFLRISLHAPKLKWVNMFLFFALIISVMADLTGKRVIANQLVQATSGVTSIYLFATGVYLYSKGLKEAKFYILSWGVLVVGALTYILTLNGSIEINFLTINSFQIGSMLEGVLLSFALADRINTYRREKNIAQKLAVAEAQKNENLIKEQNVVLEQKVEERTADLTAEKKKSDDLLLNILPEEIAEELKAKGESEARHFEMVSVLFTDFVNFTGIGETLTPKELVKELDICFKAFDEIVGRTGLEKIKTIGDAYLAVCGMPEEDHDHAKKTIDAAKEMRDFIAKRKSEGGKFEIRIGIHSGPLVAGIVGLKKFAYDIWGDTVNTASRMESNSEPGRINISGATYNLVKDIIKCEHRGKIDAKNKGMIDMYFVKS